MQAIRLKHNSEMGHRLTLSPGKCERIHGHSWWFELTISGDPHPATGMIIDFADVKRWMRNFIDDNWDHRLMLNTDDPVVPFLKSLLPTDSIVHLLPHCDPTVENVAAYFGKLARNQFGTGYNYQVWVQETGVNAAYWEG